MANQLVSIAAQLQHEIFPMAANDFDMMAYFNTIPPNPIDAVIPTRYDNFDNGRPYTTAAAPFARPWSTTQDDTRTREHLYFLSHLGNIGDFEVGREWRGVSDQMPAVAMPNGIKDPTCWVYNIGSKPVGKDWDQHIGAFVKKICSDSRGGMIEQAKTIWNRILLPQGGQALPPNSPWHQAAQTPGRLVSIFLYYIQQSPHLEPGRVKWLLGGRLRPQFDTNALFTAYYDNQRNDLVNDQDQGPALVCLYDVLVQWLEYVLAHVLTEYFKSYHMVAASRASKDMLAANLQQLSNRYRYRDTLFNNVDRFPFLP